VCVREGGRHEKEEGQTTEGLYCLFVSTRTEDGEGEAHLASSMSYEGDSTSADFRLEKKRKGNDNNRDS
jgi:hypothetical protein